MHRAGHRYKIAALIFTFVLGLAVAGESQDCTCDNTGQSVCSEQGFQISLINFVVDQNAGTSSWDYEVCNDKSLDGSCVPPKDLSHVNIDLPALGSCLEPSQQMTLAQIGGFGNAVLACGVSEKDPSCDIFGTRGTDFVGKCDVAGGDLDPGECVTMRLTIAGEKPALGPGVAETVTKAGPNCASDCILGPSCNSCTPPPPPGEECLTRTLGFWGTHPAITDLFNGGLTVCGKSLGDPVSDATNVLCAVPGKAGKGNQARIQLERQLAAAKLNLAATAANDGNCGTSIADRIAQCEALCGGSQGVISSSGCIEDLNAFNNSPDTFPFTPEPFDRPGPADPSLCQAAKTGQ